MATPTTFTNDVLCQSNFGVTGTLTTPWTRSQLAQADLQPYLVPLTQLRIWDAFATVLTGTAGTDDLGLIGGTFATASPAVRTSDLKAAGATTQYARFIFVLPPEYVAGQTVTLRAYAGMNTTVSDTTATIDFQVYRMDGTAGIGSDLCSTSATSINSLTNANKDFTIDPATLGPGDQLDVRVAVAINDAATATAVVGEIGSLTFLCDVRG